MEFFADQTCTGNRGCTVPVCILQETSCGPLFWWSRSLREAPLSTQQPFSLKATSSSRQCSSSRALKWLGDEDFAVFNFGKRRWKKVSTRCIQEKEPQKELSLVVLGGFRVRSLVDDFVYLISHRPVEKQRRIIRTAVFFTLHLCCPICLFCLLYLDRSLCGPVPR